MGLSFTGSIIHKNHPECQSLIESVRLQRSVLSSAYFHFVSYFSRVPIEKLKNDKGHKTPPWGTSMDGLKESPTITLLVILTSLVLRRFWFNGYFRLILFRFKRQYETLWWSIKQNDFWKSFGLTFTFKSSINWYSCSSSLTFRNQKSRILPFKIGSSNSLIFDTKLRQRKEKGLTTFLSASYEQVVKPVSLLKTIQNLPGWAVLSFSLVAKFFDSGCNIPIKYWNFFGSKVVYISTLLKIPQSEFWRLHIILSSLQWKAPLLPSISIVCLQLKRFRILWPFTDNCQSFQNQRLQHDIWTKLHSIFFF